MKRPILTYKRAKGLRIIASVISVEIDSGSLVDQGIDAEDVENANSALEYIYQLADYYESKARAL